MLYCSINEYYTHWPLWMWMITVVYGGAVLTQFLNDRLSLVNTLHQHHNIMHEYFIRKFHWKCVHVCGLYYTDWELGKLIYNFINIIVEGLVYYRKIWYINIWLFFDRSSILQIYIFAGYNISDENNVVITPINLLCFPRLSSLKVPHRSAITLAVVVWKTKVAGIFIAERIVLCAVC